MSKRRRKGQSGLPLIIPIGTTLVLAMLVSYIAGYVRGQDTKTAEANAVWAESQKQLKLHERVGILDMQTLDVPVGTTVTVPGTKAVVGGHVVNHLSSYMPWDSYEAVLKRPKESETLTLGASLALSDKDGPWLIVAGTRSPPETRAVIQITMISAKTVDYDDNEVLPTKHK